MAEYNLPHETDPEEPDDSSNSSESEPRRVQLTDILRNPKTGQPLLDFDGDVVTYQDVLNALDHLHNTNQ